MYIFLVNFSWFGLVPAVTWVGLKNTGHLSLGTSQTLANLSPGMSSP